MHFWNINSLANDLKTHSLSQWQKTKYYIATLLFGLFANLIAAPKYFSLLTTISFLLCGVAVVFCIIHIFNINHKADDKNFIERLICFSYPATIRTFAIYSIFICIYFSFSIFTNIPSQITSLIAVISRPITYIVLFYFVSKGFRALHA